MPIQNQYFQIARLRLKGSGYHLSRVDCIPSACYNEQSRVLETNKTIDGAQAAFIFDGQSKPAFAVVLGRHKDLDPFAQKRNGWADCISLGCDESNEETRILIEEGSTGGTEYRWGEINGKTVGELSEMETTV